MHNVCHIISIVNMVNNKHAKLLIMKKNIYSKQDTKYQYDLLNQLLNNIII